MGTSKNLSLLTENQIGTLGSLQEALSAGDTSIAIAQYVALAKEVGQTNPVLNPSLKSLLGKDHFEKSLATPTSTSTAWRILDILAQRAKEQPKFNKLLDRKSVAYDAARLRGSRYIITSQRKLAQETIPTAMAM